MTNILPLAELLPPDALFIPAEVLFTDEDKNISDPQLEYIGQLALPLERYRTYDTRNPDPVVALAEQDALQDHYEELAGYFVMTAEDEGTPRASFQILSKVLRQVVALDMSPKTIEGILKNLPEGTVKNKPTIERHIVFLRSVDVMKKDAHGKDKEATLKDVKKFRKSIQTRKEAQITQRLAFATHGRHVYRPMPYDQPDKDEHQDH